MVLSVVLLGALGASLEDDFEAQQQLTEIEASGEPGADESSPWRYSEEEDRMRNATTYFAGVRSKNTVNFDFPYSGAQRMTIQLRKSPAFGDDVIFYIEQGQILCGIYDCVGTISFDGQTEKLTLAPSADHETTVAFAKYPGAIAQKIKNADEVVVEMSFYQEGNRQFFFDTTGLEWSHF